VPHYYALLILLVFLIIVVVLDEVLEVGAVFIVLLGVQIAVAVLQASSLGQKEFLEGYRGLASPDVRRKLLETQQGVGLVLVLVEKLAVHEVYVAFHQIPSEIRLGSTLKITGIENTAFLGL